MASTVKNTTLDFGLVSLEVSLRKAGQKKDVKLDRATPEGNPLERVELDKVTGERLEPETPVQHGIFEGDQFHPISSQDLDLIAEASKEALPSIDIEEFVPLKDLPVDRIINAYYIVPQRDSGSARGLKTFLKALGKTKKAGIAKFILRSREYLGAVHAQEGRLVLSVLAFADDHAETQESAATLIDQGGAVSAKALGLAAQLIRGMEGDGTLLAEAKDELVAERQALVERARQGKTIKPKESKPRQKPRDLTLDALEESVKQVGRKKVTA